MTRLICKIKESTVFCKRIFYDKKQELLGGLKDIETHKHTDSKTNTHRDTHTERYRSLQVGYRQGELLE